MKLVTVQLHDPSLAPAVVTALSALVPLHDILVFDKSSLPHDRPAPSDAWLDAPTVARAVRARDGQSSRREALRLVFLGSDTYTMTGGEADHALRTALGGLTRALRRLYPGDPDPISRFAVRRRLRFPDGRYQGTAYEPTPAGAAVWKELSATP